MKIWCCALALLLPGLRSYATEPPARAAAVLPDDAALAAARARIGTITIRNLDIFDLSDPRENRWLFRLANRWHAKTRPAAIRAQLLFRSGELYEPRLLAETERNLRQLSYLREPRIRPTAYHDGLVDILVETHDVWTLQVGPSFGRSGGRNNTSLEFEDQNLFGFGKTLILGSSRGVDRNSNYFAWRDPTAWGSRWQDALRWASNSDGHDRELQVFRPFYSLETRYSAGLALQDTIGTDTRYALGSAYDSYRHAIRRFDIHAGWSPELQSARVLRLTAGWRRERDDFGPLYAGTPPLDQAIGPIPANRDLAFPYLRLDWLTDQFETTRNQDLIGRTEDLQFGFSGSLQAGLATPAFGADRRALLGAGRAGYGWRPRAAQELFVNATFDGRVEQGRAVDTRSSASVAWYWRSSRRTLSYALLAVDRGHALDLDHYYTLGGDNGLRGYPLRYQTGSARALLRLEERAYSDWTIWQLFNVGGAAFFEAGRTCGSNPIGVPQLGWLRDLGFGLRLGNNRSSLGNVIHIDLATPLDGRELSRLQLLVSTEATF